MPQDLPEHPPEPPAAETPGPRLPLGTRISLYYIFVVFFTFFVFRPLLAFLFLAPGERQAVLTGETRMGIGFWLGIEALVAPFVIAVTVAFVRFVDRKPLRAVGALWPPGQASRAARDLLASAAGAAAILGLWYVIAGLAVRFEVRPLAEAAEGTPVASAGRLMLLALGFLVAAANMEWILRGYIYSALREKLSWVHSGGIAALLFVMFQLLSPGIPAVGLVNAFLLGFVLAGLRELTGSLWSGTVFHGSWNFFMGSVLALPVSGEAVPALRAVEVTGPERWSGGDYGPEGSWLATVLLLAAVVALAAVLSRGEPEEAEEGS